MNHFPDVKKWRYAPPRRATQSADPHGTEITIRRLLERDFGAF